jgi:hypothetical protein
MSVTGAARAKNLPEAHIVSREVIHRGDAVRVVGRGDGKDRQQIRLGASDQQIAPDLSNVTGLPNGHMFEVVPLNALVETGVGQVVRSTNFVPTRTAGLPWLPTNSR